MKNLNINIVGNIKIIDNTSDNVGEIICNQIYENGKIQIKNLTLFLDTTKKINISIYDKTVYIYIDNNIIIHNI